MTGRLQLLSAVGFAALWTAAMWWQVAPLPLPLLALLAGCGVLVGLGWYALFALWQRWCFGGEDDAPRE